MGTQDGKVVIITGAASGQGAAEARLFADEGAKVVASDINEAGQDVVADIGLARALFHQHDVGSQASWTKVIEATLSRFQRIDVLINNAAIYRRAGLQHTDETMFNETMRVNTTGVYLGMQAVLAPMRAVGGGSIINISSLAGPRATKNMFAYATSKWAVRGMTKAAALDLAQYRIRVNSIHPGVIETPLLRTNPPHVVEGMSRVIPLGRIGQPIEVARMALYLASDGASFVTGAEFSIDGGGSF
jgi:3alpha(or 20beta)-hydroxysteroid dehydrogenase